MADLTRAYYDRIRRDRRWLASVAAVFLAVGWISYFAGSCGMRIIARKDDYVVLQSAFVDPLPESIRIGRVFEAVHPVHWFPAPDGYDLPYEPIFEFDIARNDLEAFLERPELTEHSLDEASLLWNQIRRKFRAGDVKRYFTIQSAAVTAQIILTDRRGGRRLYAKVFDLEKDRYMIGRNIHEERNKRERMTTRIHAGNSDTGEKKKDFEIQSR